MAELSDLPDEFLQNIILHNLCWDDRQSCRMVCKAWYNVTLTERQTVVESVEQQLHPDQLLTNVHMKQHGRKEGVRKCITHDISRKVLKFLRSAGHYIQSLQLHFHSSKKSLINEFFSLMPNLVNLTILSFKCDSLPFNAAPLPLASLGKLDLPIGQPQNETFIMFFSNTSRLKCFDLKLTARGSTKMNKDSLTDFFNAKVAECDHCELRLRVSNDGSVMLYYSPISKVLYYV